MKSYKFKNKKNFNIYFTLSLYFPTNRSISEKEIEFRWGHLCKVYNYTIFIYYCTLYEVSLHPPNYYLQYVINYYVHV